MLELFPKPATDTIVFFADQFENEEEMEKFGVIAVCEATPAARAVLETAACEGLRGARLTIAYAESDEMAILIDLTSWKDQSIQRGWKEFRSGSLSEFARTCDDQHGEISDYYAEEWLNYDIATRLSAMLDAKIPDLSGAILDSAPEEIIEQQVSECIFETVLN